MLLIFLWSCPSYAIGNLSYPISYEQLLTKGWCRHSSCYLHEWKLPFRPKWNERMFLFIYLLFVHNSHRRMKAPIWWMFHSVFYCAALFLFWNYTTFICNPAWFVYGKILMRTAQTSLFQRDDTIYGFMDLFVFDVSFECHYNQTQKTRP